MRCPSSLPSRPSAARAGSAVSSSDSYASASASSLSLEKTAVELEEYVRRPFSPEARAHSARTSRANSKTATPVRSLANLSTASTVSKDAFASMTFRQRMRMVVDLTLGVPRSEATPSRTF